MIKFFLKIVGLDKIFDKISMTKQQKKDNVSKNRNLRKKI